MKARPRLVSSAGLVTVALAALVALASVACTSDPTAERGEAANAEPIEIVAEDGVTLDGRLWDRGHERIAIYLHEFRSEQSSWWPHAEEPRTPPVSAMTFDFRGHGDSEGSLEDVQGMVQDVQAAISAARERGFEHVMLVGAGMGAAVGAAAAVEVPDVTVVGFSTPADFDQLDAVAAVERLDERVQLIATRSDVSAADSLHQFRALGNIDSTQARLYPGGAHGVAILDGRAGADIRARFEDLLEEFWVPRAG